MRLAIAAAFALALSPAFAQDAPPCQDTLERVAGLLAEKGVTFMLIAPEKLAEFAAETAPLSGVAPEDVTNALVADFGNQVVFGVETKDGCFSPNPIHLMAVGPKVGA